MKLIKLHKYDGDKNAVYIRPEAVTSFSRKDENNCTIVCDTLNSAWWVSETPEQILEMFKHVVDRDGNGTEGLCIYGKDGCTMMLSSID